MSLFTEAVQRFCFPLLDADDNDAVAGADAARDIESAEALAAGAAASAELAQLRARSAEEGYAAGHAQGMAAGHGEALRQAADERRARDAAVARIEALLERASASVDAHLADAVVDVVRAAVSAVVSVELHTNPAVLQSLVTTALAHLREAVGPLTLVLHPQDKTLLDNDQGLAGSTAVPSTDLKLVIRGDAALVRGDVRLETGEGSVEVSLQARLRAALAELARPLP